ncbi:MAG: 4-hydroxythreonine-4-phosphate dehydrogenase PdxA [Hyphomicrobiaceae bacterium]|nr:4-hydroxythreonine-4-phosphate dehydrogenase PdxA [Hyphomicrobiaceae bacterium]
MTAKPLALTIGEPAGIGPDIAIMAWCERRALSLPPFIVYGDAACLRERAVQLGLALETREIEGPPASGMGRGTELEVIATGRCDGGVTAGQPRAETAGMVIAAIERAVADLAAGHVSAVVTNPIAKDVLYKAGFRHPGHTEFLAELAAREWHMPQPRSVMMLASEALRVVPLTIHIPIADVPRAITRELIVETIEIMHTALVRDFAIPAPRIAVAGLNPHAGEGGSIGREEVEVIAPTVAELRQRGLALIGPRSADTLFHAAARSTYDAVLTMYHDQGLIPIKMLSFDSAVNVTLGLPFVRTSPDHGTAFDIAGSGRASPSSLVAALRLAAAHARQRGGNGCM